MGRSGHGWSARCTGQVGPAVTRPSTPDCWQGAKPPAAGPAPAGWAQGGAQEPVERAADGQGGGQVFGLGHGGGQARIGEAGSTVGVAGAGSADGHGGGQAEDGVTPPSGWAHGGGQARIGEAGSTVVVAGAGSADGHGGGQAEYGLTPPSGWAHGGGQAIIAGPAVALAGPQGGGHGAG